MCKSNRHFKISYYVFCNHFTMQDEVELSSLTKELEDTYPVTIRQETKWAKDNDKFGTQIDFLVSSDTYTELEIAKVIETLHEKILQTTFKDYIEILKDESSNYLSQNLFSYLCEIEIGLRSILKRILISAFGSEWKKKIFDDNFQIQSSKKTLESLTLEQLYFIMFVSRRFLPRYKDNELSTKTKEELIKIVQEKEILTFWELFFPKIKLKEKVCELKIYRNKIMHFKGIKHKDYEQCKELCIKIIPLIEQANSKLEMTSMATMLVDALKDIDFSAIKSALLQLAKELGQTAIDLNN